MTKLRSVSQPALSLSVAARHRQIEGPVTATRTEKRQHNGEGGEEQAQKLAQGRNDEVTAGIAF